MGMDQLSAIIAMLRERARRIPGSIPELRADFEAFTAAYGPPEGVVREPVPMNGLPAAWVSVPGASPAATLLYLHGGGYVIGSITSHLGLMARLGQAAGARVFAIDYRLAPEHAHPAAVEDALAAYRWLLSHGFDHKRIAVAGDSAGGGLALAMLTAARDAHLPMPAAAVCLSPWTDLACTGESMRTRAAADPIVQKTGALLFAELFLNGGDACHPLASPLHADVSGLPPTLIQVGGREVLLDDATRMVERLRAAGADARLDLWDEMVHVWHMFAPCLDEGREAIQAAGQFIREHVHVKRG